MRDVLEPAIAVAKEYRRYAVMQATFTPQSHGKPIGQTGEMIAALKSLTKETVGARTEARVARMSHRQLEAALADAIKDKDFATLALIEREAQARTEGEGASVADRKLAAAAIHAVDTADVPHAGRADALAAEMTRLWQYIGAARSAAENGTEDASLRYEALHAAQDRQEAMGLNGPLDFDRQTGRVTFDGDPLAEVAGSA